MRCKNITIAMNGDVLYVFRKVYLHLTLPNFGGQPSSHGDAHFNS